MSSRGSYHHHPLQLKLELCQAIRGGALRLCDAPKMYSVSRSVIQYWLAKYDRGEIDLDDVAAAVRADREAKIAALERKVGQLTMELDALRTLPSRAS